MGLIARMTPAPGLRVLISGGASGIGEAIAAAFLEAKARVHVCDVSEPTLADFRARYPAARAQQLGLPEEAMREQYVSKISLRRMTTAEDVAAMALFLCSPAARNVSGQAISVDGNVEYI